jgi:hypothetical protein
LAVRIPVATEPSEADKVADYYELANRSRYTGESVDPFLMVELKGLGRLAASPKQIQKYTGHVEQLSTGHSLSGTLFAESGETYRASGVLLRRSFLGKITGKLVAGEFTIWADAPEHPQN